MNEGWLPQIAMPSGWAARTFRGELTRKLIAEVTTPSGELRICVGRCADELVDLVKAEIDRWVAAQAIAGAVEKALQGGRRS